MVGAGGRRAGGGKTLNASTLIHLALTIVLLWSFKIHRRQLRISRMRKIRRRVAILENGYGLERWEAIYDAQRGAGRGDTEPTEAELFACENAQRTPGCGRCMGILYGAQRVAALTDLPARDPHYPRRRPSQRIVEATAGACPHCNGLENVECCNCPRPGWCGRADCPA